MNFKHILIILFTFSVKFSYSKVISNRGLFCPPKPETKPDFEAAKYLGYWYQVSGTPTFFNPEGTSCIKADYSPGDDSKINVRNTALKPNGEFKETCGFAEVPDPSKPAELVVKFPHSPAGDYWILETDYDNYVSIYTCENFLGFWKVEYAWVLARNPTNFTQEIMDTALHYVNRSLLKGDILESQR